MKIHLYNLCALLLHVPKRLDPFLFLSPPGKADFHTAQVVLILEYFLFPAFSKPTSLSVFLSPPPNHGAAMMWEGLGVGLRGCYP